MAIGRTEQVQRRIVDPDDADLAHALAHEFGMDVGEDAEIGDPSFPDPLQKHLDRAEILDPERHGGMLENPFRVSTLFFLAAARRLAIGHVLRRQEEPVHRLLVAGHDRAAQLDVETAAGQCVIDGVAGKLALAIPKLCQFLDMGGQHVVAENRAEIGDQVFVVIRLEEFKRPAVDLQHADCAGAGGDAGYVFLQPGAEILDTLGAPAIEHRFHAAKIFDPHGDRSELKNLLFTKSGVHVLISH